MLGICVSAEPRLALALLCALAAAHAHAHDKRAESESSIVSPVPFTFAARYGRSPERFITPRNDRWMLTTRYGKRSDSFAMEEELQLDEGPPRGSPSSTGGAGGRARGGRLACEYTGVLELYRCKRAQARATLARRSDEDPARVGVDCEHD